MNATSDGGYIIGGSTGSASASLDAFLLKLDKDGNQEWYRTYGGKYEDEIFVAQSAGDGGYIAVGNTYSFPSDSNKSVTNSDIYLLKLNSRGEEEWHRVYDLGDDPRDRNDFGFCVQTDHEGNYLITGRTTGFYQPGPRGKNSYWGYAHKNNSILMKVSPAGETLWTRNLGVRYSDEAYWHIIDRDATCLIAGSFYDSTANTFKMNLTRTDTSGNIIWQKRCDFFSDVHNQMIRPSAFADGYLMIGYTGDYTLDFKGVAVRLNEAGDAYWYKEYTVDGLATFKGFDATPDGGFVIGGYTAKTINDKARPFLMKIDDLGNPVWIKKYGGTEETGVTDVVSAPGGDIAFLVSASRKNTSFKDIYFLKTDKDGNLK
jgi:hypothetical protein